MGLQDAEGMILEYSFLIGREGSAKGTRIIAILRIPSNEPGEEDHYSLGIELSNGIIENFARYSHVTNAG